jgi:hypothetical protein
VEDLISYFSIANPGKKPSKGVLQPKQTRCLNYLKATGGDVPTIIGLGGSRGSAKSKALRDCAILLATEYPKIPIYIVRRVLGDLLENHMEKIALEWPQIDKLYRTGDYEYSLPNGSRIAFVYAENSIDVKRVSYGPECAFLLIDQAEQFSEDELISFRLCNRWPGSPKGFAKTGLFFNVGVDDGKGLPALGAEYLRRIFHLHHYKPEEDPKAYAFIHTFGWDNFEWFRGEMEELTLEQFYSLSNEERFYLYIHHTTHGKMMNSLPEHRRKGELLGSFDTFAGQYFGDVWGDHCILKPELVNSIIQPWWTRWMAQDWGFGDHDAHGWFATGKLSPEDWVKHFGGSCEWPVDVVIIYRELITVGRAEMDLINDIVSMTPEAERRYISDFFLSQDAPGQKSKQRGSNTVGEAFNSVLKRNKMCPFSTADQDRINGWRFMYNCLRQAGLRGCNVDKERAKQGPALFVSANCPQTIENIPLAVRDPDNQNDVMRMAGVLWEDVNDMARYGLKSKLSPKSQPPLEVRRQKVYDSVEDPTQRHLAMLKFKDEEVKRSRVFRFPSWRS